MLSISQANTDYLGDQMKSAAMQRAKQQMASGEAAEVGADDAANADDAAAAAGEDQEMDPGTTEPQPAAASNPTDKSAPSKDISVAAEADAAKPDSSTADPAQPDAGADADMPQAAEAGKDNNEQAAEGSDEEEEEEGEDEDDESDGEDVGSDGEGEAAAAEGEENQEEQVTGEQYEAVLRFGSVGIDKSLLHSTECTVKHVCAARRHMDSCAIQ